MAEGTLTAEEVKEVQKLDIPDEIKELIEEGKRLKAEKAEREATEQKTKERAKQVSIVADAKKAVLDQFPVLELVPDDRLLDAYLAASEGGEEPEFSGFAGAIQNQILTEAATLMSNAGAVKALLAMKPELRDFFKTQLGFSTPAPVAAPATQPIAVKPVAPALTNAVVAEQPTKGRTLTVAERKARAAAEADKIFRRD